MKPIFQKLTAEPEEGFAFKTLRAKGFNCPWHVHPEYELILVLQSDGYRVVGDNIASLSAGDLVFVGPGLPHIWQNESRAGEGPGVHALLIQFEQRFLGDGLLRLPAFEPVRRLLESAARGLHVTGPTRDAVSALMLQMAASTGLRRVIQFLELLGLLANSPDCHPIASATFAVESSLFDQERMNQVFQFLNSHLGQAIRLSEAARMVGLSEGAFSRFFRLHTGKTFPEFLNELRISRACRLLIEDERNITEVAYGCGFTNLSNFNRQFLRLKGVSPREFRKQMRQKLANVYA
jgi:AraC-like DNA-binding protein